MAQMENFPVLLHALTSANASQRVPAEELFQNAKAATPQELIGALLAAIGQVSCRSHAFKANTYCRR
jgi:hypothetical protein